MQTFMHLGNYIGIAKDDSIRSKGSYAATFETCYWNLNGTFGVEVPITGHDVIF